MYNKLQNNLKQQYLSQNLENEIHIKHYYNIYFVEYKNESKRDQKDIFVIF